LCCALVFLLNQYLESVMLTSMFPVCGQDCKRQVVYQNESTANHIPTMSQKVSRVNIQTEIQESLKQQQRNSVLLQIWRP
jgi:hypothetical protein